MDQVLHQKKYKKSCCLYPEYVERSQAGKSALKICRNSLVYNNVFEHSYPEFIEGFVYF